MKFVSVDPIPFKLYRFTAGNMIKYSARGCLDEGLSKFWGSFPCCKAIKSADNIMPFPRKKTLLSKALKLFRSFEGPFHISKNKKK